jgi:hypothetical protein
MKATQYTLGQRKALYISLRNQACKMTDSERYLYNELRNEFSEVMDVIFAEESKGMYILNGKAKQIQMDTFGDTYRNGWSKIKTDKDGDEYVRTAYLGKWYLYIPNKK